MNMKSFNFLAISFLVVFLGFSTLGAQTDDDIQEFLDAGQKCYEKGDLTGAALEFENVLMIDKQNFSARVWLAQIYADLKDIDKARGFLRQAASQAPDHPRVVQLQRMLGAAGKSVNVRRTDPVVNEVMTLIGSGTRLRKFGLVIPESKVKADDDERELLVFDDLIVGEEKKEEKEIDLTFFEDQEQNPISPVLSAWENEGLAAGLDKYFELILNEPSLASYDDKGIIAKGREFFITSFRNDPENTEAMYYLGMISYINGMYEEAYELLKNLKDKPGSHASLLNQVLSQLDKWKEEEKQRLLALKRAEEERQARELAEKERLEKEKQKKDVWASLKKNKEKDEKAGKASATSAEGLKLHEEGYELYKKGKLEEAIEKFEAAIAIDGDNGKFHYHLGLAWTDKGLAGDSAAFDRAITEFQRVISLMPDDKMAKDAQSMIRDIESAKKSLGN
ncbi:MAG: hypothetical protein Kow0029_21230 [Candidatus Rifleibacteriota bacterium]